MSHHPRVVNTADGSCWTRRAVTSDGRGLYALAGAVAGVPDEVLTSLAELAELGITGSAFALPMPVGPVLRSELDQARDDVMGACLARWEEEQDNARLRLALKSAQRGRRESRRLVESMCDALLGHDCPAPGEKPMDTVTRVAVRLMEAEARVADLEAERHSTNEALDDAVQALRANRAEPTEPPRIRKHHPDCAAVAMAGAPCTCPPDFTGDDPDDLVDEDGPVADAPSPYDAVGPSSPEMRDLRAALTGSPDGIAPTQALRLETGGAE